MKYHKFLIWFGLFALTALSLCIGISQILCAADMWRRSYGPSDAFPRPFLGIPIRIIRLFFWRGVLQTLTGIWLAVLRFWLAGLKRSARIALAVAHLFGAANVLLSVFSLNTPPLAMAVLLMLCLLPLAASLYLHNRYYQKRLS